MQKILIIILILLLILLIYSYRKQKENFKMIFPPLYPDYVADAYYWPTNCMDTILAGVK